MPLRSAFMTRVQLSYQRKPHTASSMRIFWATRAEPRRFSGLVSFMLSSISRSITGFEQSDALVNFDLVWKLKTRWDQGSFTQDWNDSIESAWPPLMAN